MENNIGLIANVASVVGLLLSGVAGIGRLVGKHYVLGYESMTLFLAGMGLLLVACLAKLYQVEAKLK